MKLDAKRCEQLKWLICYLEEERGESSDGETLEKLDGDELWQQFRRLVNTREPVLASDEFYGIQDDVLRWIGNATGVTQVESLPRCAADSRLSIWRGDIRTLAADAIVNAANSQMLGCWVPGHNCIDNAIHTFAGVQLREECARIMRAQGHEEPTAQAKVTSAFNLPAQWIIHTVGPIAGGNPTSLQSNQLAQSYVSCLEAAAGCDCRSIAFCCISTGVFGFPQQQAAEIAVRTVRAWLDDYGNVPMHVIFDVFNKSDELIYQDLLGQDGDILN